MKPIQIAPVAALIFTVTAFAAPSAQAADIERACVSSGRSAASSSLCQCIQGVANQLLTGREQRIAAGFFRDPSRAQEIRTSGRRSDETFWLRYKQFGSIASQRCG
ncbi:MAG: hypothetical protein ACK5IB_10120 [Qingshengfaniella sp.]